MTSIERINAVLHGEMPDMLPVVPQSFIFSAAAAGYSIGQINRKPALMAKSHIICQEKYGYDGCVIDVDDASLAEACGARVNWREDDVACVDEHHPALNSLEEIGDLELPDPLKSGRLCHWLEVTERLKDAIGDHVWIMGRADQGPFSLLALLRGAQNFMLDLMTEDEEVIRRALNWAAEAHIRFALAQREAGAHATSMGDSYASPNLVSPSVFRSFALKPEQETVRRVQTDDFPFSVHVCGDTNRILQELGETGAKILELDWRTDMKKAREILPASAVMMGNVNPSYPLYTGTPEEVRAAVRSVIESTGGRGLFVSSGCAIGGNTPPENFAALVDAAREYGTAERLMELAESGNP